MESPWDSPGQDTEVGHRSLLQGIFPTQGLNLGLPHCRQILYHLSCLQCFKRPWFNSWVGKICWRKDRLPSPSPVLVFLGFPCGSTGKESTQNAGDLGLIPGLERSPGEGKGYPHQYSGLENSMDYIVHGVAKNWTRLSDFSLSGFTLRTGMKTTIAPRSLTPYSFFPPLTSFPPY